MFLRIETELYLKRLIVGGFERVYEVGTHLPQRGHGHDATTRNSPPWKLYQAYADYKDIMDLVEELYESAWRSRTSAARTQDHLSGCRSIDLEAHVEAPDHGGIRQGSMPAMDYYDVARATRKPAPAAQGEERACPRRMRPRATVLAALLR